MDTLQNAPTSNKLINYRPIAVIAVGLMLGIAVCGIMPAGGAAAVDALEKIMAGFEW